MEDNIVCIPVKFHSGGRWIAQWKASFSRNPSLETYTRLATEKGGWTTAVSSFH